MHWRVTWMLYIAAAFAIVLSYLPVSLLNYRLSKPVLVAIGPIVSVLCVVVAFVRLGRIDRSVTLLTICAIVSSLPLLWIGFVFLLWKVFGFGP